MKKLLVFCSILFVFASCEKEPDDLTIDENSNDLIASILSQTANSSLDDSYTSGLYKGIFATYDLSQKGGITLNLRNNGIVNAAVSFINGDEDIAYFEGRAGNQPNTYHFTSLHGEFTAVISSDNKIKIPHFNYRNKDSYISAYKNSTGTGTTVAFGTFVDSTDPSFTGNWDIINNGAIYTSPAGEHSTLATDLLLVEEVCITKNGNMTTNSDGAVFNDSFLEPCFYNETFPHGWFYETADSSYREIIGYNQTSTFAGSVATWNLAYYLFDGNFFYDTPTCGLSDAAGFGDWSWNGRSGTLKVQTLVDL